MTTDDGFSKRADVYAGWETVYAGYPIVGASGTVVADGLNVKLLR